MHKSVHVPALRQTAKELARSLAKDLFETYHPELHYMRGPGPKWREKHAPPADGAERPMRLAESAA